MVIPLSGLRLVRVVDLPWIGVAALLCEISRRPNYTRWYVI